MFKYTGILKSLIGGIIFFGIWLLLDFLFKNGKDGIDIANSLKAAVIYVVVSFSFYARDYFKKKK